MSLRWGQAGYVDDPVLERGVVMGTPTIDVFAPDLKHALGGMRMLYRHVDILNASGVPAFIVHASAKFKIDWFEHQTPVLRGRVQIKNEDIAVYSEIGGLNIAEWAPGKQKVIFNQNAYYTFMRYPLEGRVKTPYLHPEVVASIVVSEDSRQYLQWVFPKLPIYRIRYSINPKLYYPPKEPKKRQICFMPRKNVEDAKQVLYMLRYRKKLTGWTIREIDKVSEARAAEIIRESAVLMSFGAPEGFGLPVAEGQASGTIVVGYHGNGGREMLTADYGFPIEVGQILTYAKTLENVLEEYAQDPTRLNEMARKAAEFIAAEYSLEAETQSVVECWTAILSS
jgi:glycosyltransferase involved in cell wall biosynthesis